MSECVSLVLQLSCTVSMEVYYLPSTACPYLLTSRDCSVQTTPNNSGVCKRRSSGYLLLILGAEKVFVLVFFASYTCIYYLMSAKEKLLEL